MFQIKNQENLRQAYELLLIANGLGTEKAYEVAIKIKKDIRAYLKKPLPNRKYIEQDDTGDSCTILMELPKEIKTLEEANEYFECTEYIPLPNSAYDCTGKAFTSWYKCFSRHGRFMAFHRICFDV